MVQGRQHHAQPALGGPPGAVLASGAGEGPAPPTWPACTARVQGPLLCLQIHSHQDVLHILIKVPPCAGRASDGWLQSELQGCSGVKHGM